MLHLIISSIQMLIFLSIWSILLYSTFIIIRLFTIDRFRPYPLLHIFLPFLVTSSLLFELAHRWESLRVSSSCSSFLSLFSSCKHISIWSLNPFQIVSSLIGDIIVLFAGILGRSCSSFISSFFSDLSWLLTIPSFFIVSFILITFVLSLQGYQLSIGYGFIKLSPLSRPLSTSKYTNEKYTTTMTMPKPIIQNELYLKKQDKDL